MRARVPTDRHDGATAGHLGIGKTILIRVSRDYHPPGILYETTRNMYEAAKDANNTKLDYGQPRAVCTQQQLTSLGKLGLGIDIHRLLRTFAKVYSRQYISFNDVIQTHGLD
ncbi:hypothetical protein QAD02_015945 [Eretmocerus hayati]|uniref:Uncharacterized protein n=1 Tax=Eretmocerus hayati TaxID=131215 RepID=A0ACC2PAM8_9HYME|nr:hypothetical protein QAD02_015945 [Eretmocerus hayati]